MLPNHFFLILGVPICSCGVISSSSIHLSNHTSLCLADTMSPLAKLLTSCLPKFRWLPDDLPDDYFPPPRDLYFPKHKRGDIIPYKNTLPRATLSLNTLPDTNILERTDNQASSFLFSKLPLELRLKIYEYIYEPKIVHISVSQSGHAGHFACEDDNSVGFSKEMKRCMCSTAVSYGARVPIAYPGSAKYAHSIGSFDLLLTCRRVSVLFLQFTHRTFQSLTYTDTQKQSPTSTAPTPSTSSTAPTSSTSAPTSPSRA